MKKLLVVVDVQKDFVDGALGSAEAAAALPEILSLVRAAEHVVYTQDTHGENYLQTREGRVLPVPHALRGSDGWKILPEVYRAGSPIFEKGTFGSLPLAEYAAREGFGDITLCGFCTDVCVLANAVLLRTLLPEAEIRVAARACAGITPRGHEAALSAMKSCQIEIG